MRLANHGLRLDTSDLSSKCGKGASETETSGGDGEGADSNLDAWTSNQPSLN